MRTLEATSGRVPCTPIQFVFPFPDSTVLQLLATNTNLYAVGKKDRKRLPGQTGQQTRADSCWKETRATVELKIIVSLIIKMGLLKQAMIPLYWS